MANNINGEKVTESYNLFALRNEKDEALIPTTKDWYSSRGYYSHRTYKDYTLKEVKRITSSGSLDQKRELSRAFFERDGAYKGYILYYATLLKYAGILIPNPKANQSLSSSAAKKRYNAVLDFVERLNIKIFCENCAQKALVDGSYFGLINTLDKNAFSYIDLPSEFCQSRFKDIYGNDLIEFNLSYFDSIADLDLRQIALDTYPKFVSEAYIAWKKDSAISKWLLIPAGFGICFPMFDGQPYFLNVIEQLMELDDALELNRERDLEEIRKIIVQKIPHNNENILLFEPDEAVEIHNGTVEMMKGNKNVSVLTTYADVDAIVSRTTSEAGSDTVSNTGENISRQSTVSNQIFSSTGSTTLSSSIKKDISIMMTFANKISLFITNLINEQYENGAMSFKYTILPVTEQLKDDYIKSAKELASLGYSQIMPALAMDISQRDLISLKTLENDVLKLNEQLIPLQNSYTQGNTTGEVGAPKKKNEEKAEQTVKNEESSDNVMGGS